jgi:hypothetical protein
VKTLQPETYFPFPAPQKRIGMLQNQSFKFKSNLPPFQFFQPEKNINFGVGRNGSLWHLSAWLYLPFALYHLWNLLFIAEWHRMVRSCLARLRIGVAIF